MIIISLDSARCVPGFLSHAAHDSDQIGDVMDQRKDFPKLGWTLEEFARSLSVPVPFLRLEVKRGRLKEHTWAVELFCWIVTCNAT
jgi:hypothetical protein